MNTKSQITLFIVLGILILLGAAVFFYLRAEVVERPAREEAIVSEIVPIEFDPVKVYVENCLTKTAMQGLKLLGERGGYIEPYLHGFSDASSVTEGNAIRFANNWLVPYWWYLSSDNKCEGSCKFAVVPERKLFLYKNSGTPSIESQLEKYVNEHLNDCLADFAKLKLQGYKIDEIDKPKTTAMVVDKAVLFSLNYPIEASRISKKAISRFTIRVDVDLKTIYDFAVLLTNLEASYHFLERYMLDLIVGLSGVNKDKLPPMTETKFEFGGYERWSKNQVYRQIKENVLPSYIQLLKVYGTRNYQPYFFPNDMYRTQFYNGNMLIPSNATFNNLAVDFDYLGWEPYFDLNCKGDECIPDSVSTDIMGLFGVQRYYFLYDLSFPALVTIRDPDAILFDEEMGYTFNFFLEGNVRNNEPMETDYTTIKAPEISGASMLCDSDKRQSGDVKINVEDVLTDKGLADVQVVYSCAGESCSIGETNSEGKLTAKFPICFNGIISFLKNDYITYSRILTTKQDRQADINIRLNPILDKRFSVKKALMKKDGTAFTPIYETIVNPVNLSAGERAIITLTRKSSLNEMPYSTYAEFSGNQDFGEIKIAPGEYEMKIDLYYYNDFEIPEKTETIEEETITYPRIMFNNTNPLPNGGLHCNSTSNAFLVTNPNFNATSIIVFKAISPNLPGIDPADRGISDLEEIGKLNNIIYTQYCYSLQPGNIAR